MQTAALLSSFPGNYKVAGTIHLPSARNPVFFQLNSYTRTNAQRPSAKKYISRRNSETDPNVIPTKEERKMKDSV